MQSQSGLHSELQIILGCIVRACQNKQTSKQTNKLGTGENAQWGKVLAAKPDTLRLVGENRFQTVVL